MTHQQKLSDTLAGTLSLRAIKSFLAAASFQNFTTAANALNVTPAAVSKQIRELEDYLGVALFTRGKRIVTLTPDGEMFKDAAQLSLINIHQAADRLRKRLPVKPTLIICCSHAFSALWLHSRLPDFIRQHPDVQLTVLATQNFITLEAGVQPDVVIAKQASLRDDYDSEQLFDDEVFPVCSPTYLQSRPPLTEPSDLLRHDLLDINPYGRSQISEHIDWKVWLALHDVNTSWCPDMPCIRYASNDYPALVNLTLAHHGLLLGWKHLVEPLLERGELIRPLPQKTVMHNRGHYLSVRRGHATHSACQSFCDWIRQQLKPS